MDITVSQSAVMLGETFRNNQTVTGGGAVIKQEEYAAAKAGTLTTRTSDTAGTLTMASGHAITTGAKVDIYWSGGIAYNATVGTVAGDSVPFTLANGDALPAAATAVTAMVVNEETFVVAAAAVRGVLVGDGGQPCVVRFLDGSDADIYVAVVQAGQSQFIWLTGMYGDNPIDANVAKVAVTHGVSSSARSPKVYVATT